MSHDVPWASFMPPLLRQHPVFTLTSDYLCPGVCAVPESCSASSTCRFVSSTESADVESHYFEPLVSASTALRPALALTCSPLHPLSSVTLCWLSSDFILVVESVLVSLFPLLRRSALTSVARRVMLA